QNGMAALYDLFQQAPELGSLLDPSTIKADLHTASFAELQPVLQKALEKEMELKNDEQAERGVMALGINSAAKILSQKFDLVMTNVPYLGANKMDQTLYDYSKNNFRAYSSDLATVFISRITKLLVKQGSFSIVSPQNWLSISSFKNCRKDFLEHCSISMLSGLGTNAFRTLMYQFHVILMIGQNKNSNSLDDYALVDLSYSTENNEKEHLIKSCSINFLSNKLQLKNPDFRILINNIQLTSKGEKLLSEYAHTSTGLQSFDKPRFNFYFWEVIDFDFVWKKCQTSSKDIGLYGGCYDAVRWENGSGQLYDYVELMAEHGYSSGIWKAGSQFWSMKGVSVSLIGSIRANIYLGEAFDTNVGAVVPKKDEYYLPLFYFLRSEEFLDKVRALDKKLMITNKTLGKVSLDIDKWKEKSELELALPAPYSNNPTQWIFKGEIVTAENPLQVAVARLLGYHYPEQVADEILDAIEDDDGIVCIPSVNGEPAAADRLREFLKAAYGAQWNNHTIEELLAQTGVATTNLETWLRESFFEQHFKLFHHRPFIWHIWDGRKDGFSVLVNYHKLTKENLQKIIFTYLGDWLRQCEAKVRNNESGADGLLLAAKALKKNLELILEGEPPHDIFIRWKPLHHQPIGWEPDINDGVRMNIRPFITANILRKKPNIKWEKDRGKNPPGSHWGEDRNNDLHLTLVEKREAKEKFEREQKEKLKKAEV
ncbi:MAG: N-6 DNA methylase, partial [Bacteroidetes bacterium]|nr:N-6 DNA methylase [Bacteroidota bacterium]